MSWRRETLIDMTLRRTRIDPSSHLGEMLRPCVRGFLDKYGERTGLNEAVKYLSFNEFINQCRKDDKLTDSYYYGTVAGGAS